MVCATSISGFSPRVGKSFGHAAHVSAAHWSAAMDQAARGDAAAPEPVHHDRDETAMMAARTASPQAKTHANAAARKNPPHAAPAKPGAHGFAHAAHAAHESQTANPPGFAHPMFLAEPTFGAKPTPAAPPLVKQNDTFHPPLAENREAAAPATDDQTHAAQAGAAPSPAGKPEAASAGLIHADAQNFESPASAVMQADPPPLPATPAPPAPAPTAPQAIGHDAAPVTSKASPKPAETKSAITSSASYPVPPLPAQAPQISAASAAAAPPIALPASGALVSPVQQAPTGPAPSPATAAPPPPPPPSSPSALAATILAMQKAGDHGTILSLDPAGLGAMTVHVSIGQAAQVNVQFVPSLPQTAHLLTAHLDDLRQNMAEAGLALGQASVRSDAGSAGGHGRTFSQDSRPSAASRPTPTPAALTGAGAEQNRRGGFSAYA